MQVRSLPKVSSKRHRWTKDEEEYFKSIIEGRHYRDIAKLMINKFGYEFKPEQLRKKAYDLGIKTGLDGGFKKGHLKNSAEIGSESTNRDGYVIVKVAHPNIWEHKHRMIYEKANGKIPKGHYLLFADKNKLNVSLDNLILVSNRELLIMNQYNLIHDNKELTITGLNIAKLIIQISEVKRR
ncbi:HNH endonuclease signature motif containing protein [Terrisporobacter mayombei]|uniref:HNH nuclease domain-containing protein n=1 Tax=Terrisporobacter mayombei TaxID=1541 RepID=A0ABY9Q0T4_9FIRM|nr:HNH endonuclease signature motif containing protein [Terrisporobacter mayombei]MCC3868481.1 HNH endonuclease [Terrisporobacter mayombei]WMT80635.1 hypothetical protein TEMA_09560 [Terrisporobacter mayombei]